MQEEDVLVVGDNHEGCWKPLGPIQSSRGMTTDPRNPSIDAMGFYGEEEWLVSMSTFAHKSHNNTPWGQTEARTFRCNSSIFLCVVWFICSTAASIVEMVFITVMEPIMMMLWFWENLKDGLGERNIFLGQDLPSMTLKFAKTKQFGMIWSKKNRMKIRKACPNWFQICTLELNQLQQPPSAWIFECLEWKTELWQQPGKK